MFDGVRLPDGLLSWGRVRAAMMGVLVLIGSSIVDQPARAQQGASRGQPRVDMKATAERMNANTLALVTATPGLTYAAFGYDLANVLNDDDNLRILPIISQSALHNVRDVRFLRGVDIGFVQTNVLGSYLKTGEIPDVADKIVYVFKVCNEEVQIIARSDITSIEQLRGKTVNFNTAGSGNQLTARDLFGRFGVKVDEVNMRQQDGLEKLKNGEIAATVLTAGKPSSVIASLKASDGYRIVPIPYNKSMVGDYLPSTLTHEDYPNLFAAGQTVDTVATGTIMIAYNWPKNSDRYRRIDKFVKAFFPRLAEFQKPPRHEKWRETNLATTVPGWKRFEGAEEWLKAERDQVLAAKRDQFQEFLADRHISAGRAGAIPEAERNQLFEDFLKWSVSR
jgi:TRAP transporter TAXI family solute receptor